MSVLTFGCGLVGIFMDSWKQSPVGSISNRYFCNRSSISHISFIWLCDIFTKLEAENHTRQLSHSFWAWLTSPSAQSFTRMNSSCWLGLQSHLKARVFLRAQRLLGRILLFSYRTEVILSSWGCLTIPCTVVFSQQGSGFFKVSRGASVAPLNLWYFFSLWSPDIFLKDSPD